MEENQQAADTAGKQPEAEQKKEAEAEKAAAELRSALGDTKGDIPSAVARTEKPRQAPEMLKKKYPRPADMKPAEDTPPPLPSKTSLKDIPLPPRMKTADGTEKFSDAAVALSRAAREMGLGPRPNTDERKRVVAVANDRRTEISKDTGLPVIRTYAADLNREIKARGATLTTIIGAERERVARERSAPKPAAPSAPQKKTALIIGSLALVAVGIGAVIAAFLFSAKEDLVPPEASLLYANARITIALDDDTPLIAALADAREDATIALGEIEHIVITKDGALLGPEAVLKAFGAPEALARNATRLMLGVHAFDRNQPFIVLTTSFYDLSFQAMLSWEETMAETLQNFVKPVNTTTPPPPLEFSDLVYKNIDVRKTVSGWPLLYAFPSKETLIITTNTNTLNEILTRLAASPTR